MKLVQVLNPKECEYKRMTVMRNYVILDRGFFSKAHKHKVSAVYIIKNNKKPSLADQMNFIHRLVTKPDHSCELYLEIVLDDGNIVLTLVDDLEAAVTLFDMVGMYDPVNIAYSNWKLRRN